MRTWFSVAGICIFIQGLFGQTALSRNEVIRADTCLGTAAVQSAPAEPSHDLLVAVFGNTLRDDELAHFRQEVALLYQAVGNGGSLRLAVIFGGNIQFAGPFRTRNELQAAAAELTRASPGIADAMQPVRFYAYLGKLAPQFGGNWSTLLLVGHFPAVDRDVFAYTAAWLATQFCSARLRVSYWFPSGEASELLDAVSPATGGMRSVADLASLAPFLKQKDEFREVLERYSADPWQSPATRALRGLVASNDGARLQVLGPEFDDTFGCSHPHLRIASPYEEYEKDLLPRRLAERTAEFKLYLARYADTEGIPASALEALAEPAARTVLTRMRMSDFYDWHSALAAYSTLDSKLLGEALAKR